MKKIFCIPGGGDIILFGKLIDSGAFFSFVFAFVLIGFYSILGILFH